MRVRLLKNGNGNILTPFGISDYSSAGRAGHANPAHLVFEVVVEQEEIKRVSLTIANDSGLVLQRELPAAFHVAGRHEWTWDGFDHSGIFDTRALRNAFTFDFRSEGKGGSDRASIKVQASRAGPDWVDAVVDRSKKTADVELRVQLEEGSTYGIGELPPAEVQNLQAFKALPRSDSRRLAHRRVRSFVDLQRIALDGIKLYWSRAVNTSEGSISVSVNPIPARHHAMDDISIAYNTNRKWLRSSNPGRVRGLYSLFGNFVPERIAYNVGWIQYTSGWTYRVPMAADREFALTAAHELGHEILSAYGGDAYSYSHRGTSSVITQKPKSVASGGLAYPSTGSIDLMKYYNGFQPANYYSMITASEQDVKSLLWLSRVQFRA